MPQKKQPKPKFSPPGTPSEAEAAARAEHVAALKARRQKLRRGFSTCAYLAFSCWILGTMLTIFSKGITLPGERSVFGSPWGLGLILLGVGFMIGAARFKARLNSVIGESRAPAAAK